MEHTKKRKTPRKIGQYKKNRRGTKIYKCNNCHAEFRSLDHWKTHIKDSEECFSNHQWKCENCSYLGYKQEDLSSHTSKKEECLHFYRNRDVLTGIVPHVNEFKLSNHCIIISDQNFESEMYDDDLDMFNLSHNEPNLESNRHSSIVQCMSTFNLTRKTVDGSSVNVTMNISDPTEGQRNLLLKQPRNRNYEDSIVHSAKPSPDHAVNFQMSINEFYKKGRTVARIKDSQFQSCLYFDTDKHNQVTSSKDLPSVFTNKDYSSTLQSSNKVSPFKLPSSKSSREVPVEIGFQFDIYDEEMSYDPRTLKEPNQMLSSTDKEQLRVVQQQQEAIAILERRRMEDISRDEELEEMFDQTDEDSEVQTTNSSISEENIDMFENESVPTINNENNVVQEDVGSNDENMNVEVQQGHSLSMDMRSTQQKITSKQKNLALTNSDLMSIDLFHIMRASNAPMSMFDRLIKWSIHHHAAMDSYNNGISSHKVPTRQHLITSLNKKLNFNELFCHPRVASIALTSGRSTSVVTFSAKDLIMKVLSNKSLLKKENILLDVENPTALPLESGFLGEVNSGSWHKMAVDNICTSENDLLMPWCFFIDGLKVDKFGKLTVEAVLASCLWFNRETRNRSSAWSILGFVEDQKLFRDYRSYVRDDKAQDYHDMLSHIFSEFRQILDDGGLKVDLDFGVGNKHTVVIKPVIQFIIGDCKGNDLLCGRKAGHSLKMKGLCRDCNISPDEGDDPCQGRVLKCKFHCKDTIEGKSRDELDAISFLCIRNAFSDLSFGGCPRSIWGATPAEILHAIQLGLCEYIADALESHLFTESALDLISSTIIGILSESKRQSVRDIPDLGAFRLGLMSVKSLKAKERFARVFCLYLALSNSYCIKALCSKKRKQRDGENARDVPMWTIDGLRAFKNTVEETIMFHQWMKKDLYPKSDFEDGPDGQDCRAQSRVKTFLQNFKTHVVRSGNGLKTPKFHQMLHTVDYIRRFGAPSNWDGSRAEHFGKVIVKDNARLTNKQRDTLNFDISRRVCETDIIDEVSRIYYENSGRWPSRYCNDTDLMMEVVYNDCNNVTNDSEAVVSQEGDNNETVNHDNNITNTNADTHMKDEVINFSKPRFHIVAKETHDDGHMAQDESVNPAQAHDIYDISLDWGSSSKTPLLTYPLELQKRFFARLFIGSPNIGGKVKLSDTPTRIPCFTEVKVNDVLYRCHPCYAKKGSWYDWAMFDWEGYEEPIPGKILMMVDLRSTEITYEADVDPDNVNIDNVAVHKHLTNDVWVIIHAAVSPSVDHNDDTLTDFHFDSQIHKWVKLTNDSDLWTVPLSALAGPCYVVRNRDFVRSSDEDNEVTSNHDSLAYVLKPMSEWGDSFLPPIHGDIE